MAARDAVIKLVIIFLKIVFFDTAPSRKTHFGFLIKSVVIGLSDLPPSL